MATSPQPSPQKPPRIGRKSIGYDRFYTKEAVAEFCVGRLNLEEYDAVIEPAAGDGAFCKHINHPTLLALDIAPQGKNIKKQDFFTFRITPAYERVLVIGNPPFGIHHRMSDAFLTHAFSFANVATVAFILPNTYRKHTRQKIIPTDYRIKAVYDIGRDAFIHDGKDYHVPCSFFIIDKSPGKDLRIDPTLYTETADFSFGSKDDFAFFMFGSNPARLTHAPAANNRGYFIKPKIAPEKLARRLQSIDWQGNSCANGGVAWFSKCEVVMQYKAAYGDIGG